MAESVPHKQAPELQAAAVQSDPAPAENRISALSGPGLLIGLLCVVVTCVAVCYAELVVGKIQIGFLQLPPVVVGMLVLLLGVQAALKRLSPKLRLKPHELFTIHIMMLFASMVSSRGLLLTGFLDAMKFADGVRVKRRSLVGVFSLSLVVAILVAGYLHISLPYKLGAVQMYGYVYQGNPVWAFQNAATVLNRSQGPLPFVATLNFIIGAVVTVLLATLRTRLLWFPLHPLGYALSGTWTMMVFWFPCFVAWLLKVFILRYGGMRLYSRPRPLFLGMVLGEFTTAILFTLPALYNRYTPTPSFPWP